MTNRHALDIVSVNEDPIKSVEIFTRENPEDLTEISYHNLNLFEEDKKTWYGHPEDPVYDIAVVPLNAQNVDPEVNLAKLDEYTGMSATDAKEADAGTFAFSQNDLRPDDVIAGAGTQAMIIGYPIPGASPYFPYIRIALISSPYGIGLNEKLYFATEHQMHGGTSGSPVLTVASVSERRPDGVVIAGSPDPYLIGVHSAELLDPAGETSKSLDLHQAWYIESVIDIIESI